MEKEMKKKEQLNLNHQIASKEERGITLIALVVTIVVLLILAGITISLVFGSNGVIQKAQDSKERKYQYMQMEMAYIKYRIIGIE